MIMLHGDNHLSIIKKIKKAPAGSPQPGNPREADQPAQPPVSFLNVEVTIALKYLNES